MGRSGFSVFISELSPEENSELRNKAMKCESVFPSSVSSTKLHDRHHETMPVPMSRVPVCVRLPRIRLACLLCAPQQVALSYANAVAFFFNTSAKRRPHLEFGCRLTSRDIFSTMTRGLLNSGKYKWR